MCEESHFERQQKQLFVSTLRQNNEVSHNLGMD